MDLVLAELAQGWPDRAHAVAIVLRALTAALLGGVVGFERARAPARMPACAPTCWCRSARRCS